MYFVVRAVSFLTMLLTVGLSIFGGYMYFEFNSPGELEADRVLIIPKGSGLNGIASLLNDNEVIKSKYPFILGAKILGLSGRLKAGEYKFSKMVQPVSVLKTLATGRTMIRYITIPEGLTSNEIVRLLKEKTGLSGTINSIPSEGTLLPETYYYSFGDSRLEILNRMQRQFTSKITELWGKRNPNIPVKTSHEAVILASIIEKETAVREERFLIASVFTNRLYRKMRLQSDPTVLYGVTDKEPNEPITRTDLRRKTSHNTYVIQGLPKTPICNPGIASIEAALHPATTGYFYFVAKGGGRHSFSKTLKEHNKNVKKWREIQKNVNK
tara:strand:- start:1062 stop:2039 length:978 start_codon:yes stop_codon:yes gene_type:complete